MNSREFDAIATVSASIPGWLTRDQARVLHDAAAAVPRGGCVVEIGSHQGRSTVVLAAAVPPGARVVAIDPFVADWRYGGPDTEHLLGAHLVRAGVATVVDVRPVTSSAARAVWSDQVDALYVDGKHDALSLVRDLRWSRWVPDGGTVLVHDAFSSVGVTLGLGWVLLTGRRLVYRGRTGSLARMEIGRPSALDRLRPAREVPWFVRNVVVKVLLRAGLGSWAAVLGHHDTDDPY